jgi:hypothetical protein
MACFDYVKEAALDSFRSRCAKNDFTAGRVFQNAHKHPSESCAGSDERTLLLPHARLLAPGAATEWLKML